MTRKRICGYCGKPLEGAGYPGIKEKETCYCSPECRKKHEAALVKIRKNLKWFAAGIAASILLVLHPGDLRDVWLCEDDEAGKGNGDSRHPVRPVDDVESLLISGKYMIERKRPSAGRISCPAKGRCYL